MAFHKAEVMPTVMRAGPYRFFFYRNESNEPPHIHVERDDSIAKFWLAPVSLASASGFASHELNTIERIVSDNRDGFTESWDAFFSP